MPTATTILRANKTELADWIMSVIRVYKHQPINMTEARMMANDLIDNIELITDRYDYEEELPTMPQVFAALTPSQVFTGPAHTLEIIDQMASVTKLAAIIADDLRAFFHRLDVDVVAAPDNATVKMPDGRNVIAPALICGGAINCYSVKDHYRWLVARASAQVSGPAAEQPEWLEAL